MADIWKPQSIEVYQSWIDAISEESSEKLTSWETDFIDSIQARLISGRTLTERQAEVLERIYAEKTK
jgi:thiaminase